MALSEDQSVRLAMGEPPRMDIDTSPDDRQALLTAIAHAQGPQRVALQTAYDRTYGGAGGPPIVARAMRDGFPETRANTSAANDFGAEPPAPKPAFTPLRALSLDDVEKGPAAGRAPGSGLVRPLSLEDIDGPPKKGVLQDMADIARDPEGGYLAAAGRGVSHLLGGDSAPSTSGGVAATAADVGRKAVVGLNDLGESAVGLISLATGGVFGEQMAKLGYDPKAGDALISSYNSVAQQQADQNVAEAQGFLGKLAALAVEPRAVLGQVVEMLPGLAAMGTGGAAAAGRAVRATMPAALDAAAAAGLEGKAAEQFIAKFITEKAKAQAAAQLGTSAVFGGQTAGTIAEQGRASGQDYSTYAPAALVAGLATVATAYGSKAAASAMGVGDVSTDLATRMAGAGASRTTGTTLASAAKEGAKGALENAAFSGISGVGTNVATGQDPLANDIGGQMGQGAFVGGAFSAAHGALAGKPAAKPGEPAPVAETQHPLTEAMDGYLRSGDSAQVAKDIAGAPTVEAAIDAAHAHSQTASALLDAAATTARDVRAEAGRQAAARAAIDALTTAPGEAPKVPEAPISAPAAGRIDSSQYADLTPMDRRTAEGRLRAMQDMEPATGEGTGLNVVDHPDGTGRYAIGRVGSTPDAERAGPATKDVGSTSVIPETNAPAAPAEPPKTRQVVSALKLPPHERSAVENARIQAAERHYSPEDMNVIRKAAGQPFAMTAAERVRFSDLKASEARDEAPAAPVATARPQENVRTEEPGLPRQSEAKAGELSQETHHVIVQMARMLGKKVVVQGLGNNDGQVSPRTDPNTIYLNRTSSKPHLVVFGHEIYHLMKAEHPEAAKVLADAMGLKDDANLDVPGIRGDHEEVQSDLHGNRFAEPQFWVDTFRKVLETDGAPATMRLGATIAKTIRKMTRALGGIKGYDTDSMVKDLGAVRDAASTALSQYIRSRKGAAQELDRQEVSGFEKTESPTTVDATGAKFSESRGKLEPDDLQTKATGKDGDEYDVILHKEMLGDRLHSVFVKAEDADGKLAGWVEFNRRYDGVLEGGMVKSERRANGVAEILYRAARAAGYDIGPSATLTGDGRGFVARLAEKGVINKPPQYEPGRGVLASEKRPEPHAPARKVAEDYMASRGQAYAPPTDYAEIDPARGKRIADAFEAMEHDPQDPKVRRSYEALSREVVAQFKALQKTGLKIEFMPPGVDKYNGDLRGMDKDVRENNHMWLLPTEDSFGNAKADTQSGNPLLKSTPYKFGGKPAVINDLFRAVHDYFGHVQGGVDFSARGENHAYRSHAAMFSDEALPALTTETRGQNNWQWFGPHGEENTAAGDMHVKFADQKIGLLPDWAHADVRASEKRDRLEALSTEIEKSGVGTRAQKIEAKLLDAKDKLRQEMEAPNVNRRDHAEVVAALKQRIEDLSGMRAGAGVADRAEAHADIAGSMDKELKTFHKSLGDAVRTNVEYGQMLARRHDWLHNVGDTLLSTKTGKTYEITARTFRRVGSIRNNDWQAVYLYKTRDGEKGQFDEQKMRASKTLKNLTTPQELKGSEKRNDDGIDVEGIHYSQQPRKVLSTAFAGSGYAGAERERDAAKNRLAFYVDKGQGIRPESGVGPYAHKAMLRNLYDAGNDPGYLKEDAKDDNDFEQRVQDAGYNGYYAHDFTTRQGAAVLLGQHEVPVEQVGQGARPPNGREVLRRAREDVGYRADIAALRGDTDLPAGQGTGERWQARLEVSHPEIAAEMARLGVFARIGDEPVYKDGLIRAYKDAAKTAEPKGTALLNIGLDVSDENGGGKLSLDEVKQALQERGRQVLAVEVRQGSEPTAVVRLDRPLSAEELGGLSRRLRQDAIAQRADDGTGMLEGPKAAAWGGKYVPDYFRRMDGRTDTEHGAPEVRASAKREELNPDVVATLGKHIRNLLPDERARLRRDTAEKFVRIISSLPSANEMAAVSYAGRAKRGWYAHSAAAMEHVFGADAPRFAALLAALSPQTGVQDNLRNALHVWRAWVKEGRPTTPEEINDILGKNVQGDKGDKSVLDAWRNNSIRALTREDGAPMKLSGPKVNSFFKNLIGHVEEVTNDTWMANFALVSQKIFAGTAAMDALTGEKLGQKSPGYMAMSAQVRAAAKVLTRLTGEEWTPAEVQETIWSWAKSLYERANVDESAVDLVKNKALTDELINSTPDFRTLFHADTNERILRDAGYGDRLDSLRDRSDLEFPGDQERGAEGQAAPFAEDSQQRYEVAAARRLDALRARGREPVEDDEDTVLASEKREPSDEELGGRKVTYPVHVEETGETAHVTVDAREELAAYKERESVMQRLAECLAR